MWVLLMIGKECKKMSDIFLDIYNLAVSLNSHGATGLKASIPPGEGPGIYEGCYNT